MITYSTKKFKHIIICLNRVFFMQFEQIRPRFIEKKQRDLCFYLKITVESFWEIILPRQR